MAKVNHKLLVASLSLGGIAASFLPWSGFHRGSLPPGNLPDTVFYGYQVNGKYVAACFLGILLLFLLTLFRKSMSKMVARLNALLALIALLVGLIDIVKTASQGSMTGVVPFLREGPYVTTLIAFILFFIFVHIGINKKDEGNR